jgi:hypothetical protein
VELSPGSNINTADPSLLESFFNGHRSVIQVRPEFFAFEQFSDDVWGAFVGADVVDGQDVRMIERERSFGLLYEAPHWLGILCELGGQEFQRDLAVKARIFGEIDFAHPARAEFCEDAVVGQRGLSWEILIP